MDTIFKTIIAVTFAVLTIIAGVFSFVFLQNQKVQIENNARFQCAKSVRYSVKQANTTITYPPADLYKKCLNEKGINN